MTVPPSQIIPPNAQLQLVNPNGTLTTNGMQFLTQLWTWVVDTNQVIPCTCTNSSNVYQLTPFPAPPSFNLPAYSDYSIYTFVASAGSTGSVTAQVGALGTINVYKSNGSTQAGNGDIVHNDLYLLIYNSNLNSAAGGFVLK
jgi:hypothetical protein